MKRIATLFVGLFLAVLVVGLIASAPKAQAVDVLKICNSAPTSGSSEPAICKDRASNNVNQTNPLVGPQGILTTYIHILSLVVGLGAVIVIIISGFRYIVSNGDPQNTAGAQKGILYAVVGLAVALFAQLLVSFVISRL